MSQISFIHGFHAIIAKLRHQPDAIQEIFIDADRHDARMRDLLRHAELQGVKVMAVDAKRLEAFRSGAGNVCTRRESHLPKRGGFRSHPRQHQ